MLILRRKKLEEFIRNDVRENCNTILQDAFDKYEKRRFNFATAVDYINQLVAAGIKFKAGKNYKLIIEDKKIWLNLRTNECYVNGDHYEDGANILVKYYGK